LPGSLNRPLFTCLPVIGQTSQGDISTAPQLIRSTVRTLEYI